MSWRRDEKMKKLAGAVLCVAHFVSTYHSRLQKQPLIFVRETSSVPKQLG